VKNEMKVDLNKKLTLTKWQLLQMLLIFISIGAGITLINNLLGFVLIGITIIILALPIIFKVFGEKETDESD